MGRKKPTSQGHLRHFFGVIVVLLLAVDLYAVWRIQDFTGSWCGFISYIAAPLNQLVLLLVANIVVLVVLVLMKPGGK